MSTVQTQILDRIRRKGRGKVFITKDFLDLGSRDAADQALSRLAKAGEIHRLGRGLYDYPRMNVRLGIPVSPDPDQIAGALARQTGSRIAPSSAMAANRLGLSTQVPAKPIYLTDGRTRQVRVGNMVYIIKHVPPKELPAGSAATALVIQGLRHIGQRAIDQQVISRLRRSVPARQRVALLRDARYTTDWIADVIRQIADNTTSETSAHG
jgi:hypothetical protein